MTGNGTIGGSMNPPNAGSGKLQRFGATVRRTLRVSGYVLAAFIIALVTAFVGVFVMIAALILRLSRGGNKVAPGGQRAGSAREAGDASETLEARRTGHGWTVE